VTRDTEPKVTVAAAMAPVAAPSCSAKPVDRDATDVAIFLAPAATGQQLSAVGRSLHTDTRVGVVQFEDRMQAFERFKALWADDPDLVKAVSPARLPESFRIRLSDPGQYAALRTAYAAMPGVDQVVGRKCPAGAPVGGLQ
jgi:cell division protein FtsX